MSNDPGDASDGPDEGGQNPFRGTPFEQFFGGSGTPDLGALFSQLQALMQPSRGSPQLGLHDRLGLQDGGWIPRPDTDPEAEGRRLHALTLADHWLDDATPFPSGVTSTAA